ncbi:MAG: elongation factor G, partial [bacterium]
DFTAEVERSLRVMDGCVVIFCGVGGVEAQSETVWRQADRYAVPRICFVNKLDRIGSDFHSVVDSIQKRLRIKPIPIQLPIGKEKKFQGIIDLVKMKAFIFTEEKSDNNFTEIEIPQDMVEEAEFARETMIETIAEYSENLMEKYLHNHEISESDLVTSIREAIIHRQITPVLCGSALRNKGVQLVLDAVCDYLPSPEDIDVVVGKHPERERIVKFQTSIEEHLSSLAFKVISDEHGDLVFLRVYSGTIGQGQQVYNPRARKSERIGHIFLMHADNRKLLEKASAGEIVAIIGLKYTVTGDTLCEKSHQIVLEKMTFPEPVVTMAIEPKTAPERKKLLDALERISKTDPTFTYKIDEETGQTMVSGMGELHLEIIAHELLEVFHIEARIGKPQVAYRETISSTSEAKGTFSRQIAGKQHTAGVTIRLEPASNEQHIKVKNLVPQNQIRKELIKSIEEGIRNSAESGMEYGYPLINLQASILDVNYVEGESSEVAFHAAASNALHKAASKSKIILLEPQMKIEIHVPEENFGGVIEDLSGRKAQVTDVAMLSADMRVIRAIAPMAAMFGYANALRSSSQGKANYTMEPYGYAPVSDERIEMFES